MFGFHFGSAREASVVLPINKIPGTSVPVSLLCFRFGLRFEYIAEAPRYLLDASKRKRVAANVELRGSKRILVPDDTESFALFGGQQV